MSKQQYESSAKAFIIAIIVLIALAFFLVIKSNANGKPQTGYVISVEAGKKTTIHKVFNPAVADSIIGRCFGNSITGFSTVEALKSSPFYIHQRSNVLIYVEKKQVKYTRNGKIKFKKIRK